MRRDPVSSLRRKLVLGAIGLSAGFATVAGLMVPSPDVAVSAELAANVPTAAAVDSLQPARDMMRSLRGSLLTCDHDGCVHGDGVIACAMYAPGYRPKKNGQDTPNIGASDEFNVQNPSWKWPQPGGLGTPVPITYSYSNLLDGSLSVSNVQLKAAVEEALSVWAAEAPLIFTEIPDTGPLPTDAESSYPAGITPNLRFGHHTMDGASGVLAHAYFPSSVTDGLPGDLHFDSAENWDIAPSPGKIDFLEVALHEIGHTLGLGHQNPPPTAIMNPFYGERFSGLGSAFLFQDDIDGIKSIYVTGAPSGGCLIEQLVQKTKQSVLKTVPKKLLGAVDQPEPLLKDLRRFRDTVLLRTDVGRQLAGTYYKHGGEVFAAIAQHPALAGEALSLAVELRSSFVQQGQVQPNVAVSRLTYERGLAWLDRVEPLVSDDARQAIVAAKRSLADITHATGRTVTIRFEDAGR
ncbi:MAG: matrixin family metalloprotease [Planctomycetaceae bacterium]|nr:matrixin family metalloprotease [Planctomycetaceae bacterium]